ncbi:MAG: TrkA family potassium uptake protein [Bacilli bacterium]|nr:TrkA family potassium uptake protein [Bacilli bacterium]
MRKTIVVIGLGRFGLGLVKNLALRDVEIIAIDKDKNNVAKVGDIINNAVVCDSTKAEVLEEVGVTDADNAIIAFGQDSQENIATTILTVVALKKVGVKKITCRIDDSVYEELLIKIGADNVIYPFDIASQSLALKVSSSSVMDYYNISEGYKVFDILIRESTEPINLMKLNAPTNFGVNIILVHRGTSTFMPNRESIIKPGDHIFVFGEEKGVYKLEAFLENSKEDK